MKRYVLLAATLTMVAGTAQAGNLDRSGTPVGILFEEGNYAELSFGYTEPDLTGTDASGVSYSSVGDGFGLVGGGIKADIPDSPLSFALIFDQPYGADILYGGTPGGSLLGGTAVDADSEGYTALMRYRIDDRISVYGGPRVVRADGDITLSGLAYGPLNGYNVQFGSSRGVGFVAGAAYEIPEIAFRAALTYHSAIDLDMDAVETIPVAAGGTGAALPTGQTNVELPQSVKLDLQTGIAEDTLLFGSVRWAEWQAFSLVPPAAGMNLAEIDNSTTYEIGLGRRFTDDFSASLTVSYEHEDDDLKSPLAPTGGSTAVTLGGEYRINETVTLSGAVRYTWLGNATVEVGTPDTPVGRFANNEALSAGLKIGVHF